VSGSTRKRGKRGPEEREDREGTGKTMRQFRRVPRKAWGGEGKDRMSSCAGKVRGKKGKGGGLLEHFGHGGR